MTKLFGGTLHTALIHAVTAYDRKRSNKRYYNIYALAQYLKRIEEVEADIKAGATPRAALVAAFSGPLLDCTLKAIGEAKHTREEKGGRVMYVPASER